MSSRLRFALLLTLLVPAACKGEAADEPVDGGTVVDAGPPILPDDACEGIWDATACKSNDACEWIGPPAANCGLPTDAGVIPYAGCHRFDFFRCGTDEDCRQGRRCQQLQSTGAYDPRRIGPTPSCDVMVSNFCVPLPTRPTDHAP